MPNLHKSTFLTGFLVLLTIYPFSFAEGTKIEQLTKELQKTLNDKNKSDFYKLVSEEIANDIEKKYDVFLTDFPNAKWQIKPSQKLKDNRQSIEIIVTGNKKIGDHTYSLISNQKLAIKTKDGKITKQEIISDYSILNTNKKDLEITIAIPDIVLTGSKYDIDLIIEKPINNTILAGGLIALNSETNNINLKKEIELSPRRSGGLFKSVRAPYQPGKQRWAALIAHPKGIVSITKNVKVVSNEIDLKY